MQLGPRSTSVALDSSTHWVYDDHWIHWYQSPRPYQYHLYFDGCKEFWEASFAKSENSSSNDKSNQLMRN